MHSYRRALAPMLAITLGFALGGLGVAMTGPAQAAGGPAGSRLTLIANESLSGYDALTTPDGTTYVGWIGDESGDAPLRQLHLCVLRQGSTGCVGGVQTGDSLGIATAANLKVVDAAGQVELVWITQPETYAGDFGGTFGVAAVTNGVLGTPTPVAGAPTYGTLTSAIATASGAVGLAVIGSSTLDNTVYYYPYLGAQPTTLNRPYFVGNAQLADNGKQTVLTTSEYGSLSGKVSVASKASSSTTWGGFSTVAHSYTGGNIEQLRVAGGKIRMVGMSDKALYTPYDWTWSGSSFGNPTSTGDQHDVSSIDATSDASGRLVTVSSEVGGLAVANFGGGKTANTFTLPVKQTYAGGPAQIVTSPSGRGWVIYSIQTQNNVGQILLAQPIRLGALTVTVHKKSKAGTLFLTGPRTCLPVTTVKAKVKGKPARHWKVASTKLKLGSKSVHSSINGAKLKAHHHYTLTGSVTFRDGGHRTTVTKNLKFSTCGRP